MRAAVEMGRLMARGLLDVEECMAALMASARSAAPARDIAGLRARLAQTLADAAREEARARNRAARCVGAALRAGLRAGMTSAGLRAACREANASVLRPGEIAAIAAREITQALGTRGR